MDANTKQLWLNRVKQGKVAVIESHYAPSNRNCLWLKDGVLMVYGNEGWETLSSGDVPSDPRLVPPTSYPFEVPYSGTQQGGGYDYKDAEGLLEFTYIPEDLVYVIGKSGNYYTLIGTLDAISIWGSLFPNTDYYESYGNIINSQSALVGQYSKYNNTTFFVSINSSLPQYDSVIFDTEYNTDKYPEEGDPQVA